MHSENYFILMTIAVMVIVLFVLLDNRRDTILGLQKKMTKEELEILWKDKNNWYWGAIYHCKNDPRLVVPKPVKWTGWTMNFAYPWRAIGFILFIILAAYLPIFIEMKLNIATPVVICATLVVIAVLIIGLSSYLSSKTE